jgi:tetratricopeptide (TPR) repeat protein
LARTVARWPKPETTNRLWKCSTARIRQTSPIGTSCWRRAPYSIRWAATQRYYLTALKIVPDEPSVLSNLGLSYALSKNLREAEATLRRAAAQHPVDSRIRQNLALVVGLQGRFAEAESIARADLPADEAAANAAYLKQMLAHRKDLHETTRSARAEAGAS